MVQWFLSFFKVHFNLNKVIYGISKQTILRPRLGLYTAEDDINKRHSSSFLKIYSEFCLSVSIVS